jgi:hypothetical protein
MEGAAKRHRLLVMPGLDPGIHAVALRRLEAKMEWIAGSCLREAAVHMQAFGC